MRIYLADSKLGVMKMPPAIEQSVRRQNIKFMHNRNQFSAEYFHFMRRLACCNAPPTNRQHNADKLVSRFITNAYFCMCISKSQ